MSTFRVHHDKDRPYVLIDKKLAQHKQLSLRAKGLMLYFLSLPDNYEICLAHVLTQITEGKHVLYAIMTELIDFRYVKRTVMKNELGRITSYHYDIYETPYPLAENQEMEAKPLPDLPLTDSPVPENPTPNNTEIQQSNERRLNNKNYNKKILKKSEEEKFMVFYEHYPRKKARGSAYKAWLKLSDAEKDQAVAAAEAYFLEVESWRVCEKPIDAKFIPYPASWLNSQSYLDTYKTPLEICREEMEADLRAEQARKNKGNYSHARNY